MHDLTDAVEECADDIIVTRHVSVALNKGRKASARTERFKARATITPLTGQDIRRLSEGTNVEGTHLIICTSELKTSKSSPCEIADEIAHKGSNYQIGIVKDWFDLGGFYECVGTRLKS